MKNLLKKLSAIFDRQDKRKAIILMVMMLVAAVLETFSITLILPFINSAVHPESILENDVLRDIYVTLNLTSARSFIILCGFLLVVVFIVKNLYLFIYNKVQFGFIYNAQVKLSESLLTRYLEKPYVFHLQTNSAELVRNVYTESVNLINKLITPLFNVLAELFVAFFILTALMIIAPLATTILAVFFVTFALLFFITLRKKMNNASKAMFTRTGQMLKCLNQAFGGIKEIKATDKERFFVETYKQECNQYEKAATFSKLLNSVPSLFIETVVASSLLLIVLVIMMQRQELTSLVSIFAVFGMAAFRLLPSVTNIINQLTKIRLHLPSINVIYKILKNPGNEQQFTEKTTECRPPLKGSIELNDIEFTYPEKTQKVLSGLSLSIPVNKSIAFIGESGSGKTTLVDIILGILVPQSGSIFANGKSIYDDLGQWKSRIGYIPQFIYLTDDTIRKNIAFGVKESDIDESKVIRAIEMAQLCDFTEGLEDNINTIVGERGVRLSGGQRQRIGIARALYNDPEILILDEATSSLDTSTEKEIMESIYTMKGIKTIIIIAHRLSTIAECDMIFDVEKSKILSESEKASIFSNVKG